MADRVKNESNSQAFIKFIYDDDRGKIQITENSFETHPSLTKLLPSPPAVPKGINYSQDDPLDLPIPPTVPNTAKDLPPDLIKLELEKVSSSIHTSNNNQNFERTGEVEDGSAKSQSSSNYSLKSVNSSKNSYYKVSHENSTNSTKLNNSNFSVKVKNLPSKEDIENLQSALPRPPTPPNKKSENTDSNTLTRQKKRDELDLVVENLLNMGNQTSNQQPSLPKKTKSRKSSKESTKSERSKTPKLTDTTRPLSAVSFNSQISTVYSNTDLEEISSLDETPENVAVFKISKNLTFRIDLENPILPEQIPKSNFIKLVTLQNLDENIEDKDEKSITTLDELVILPVLDYAIEKYGIENLKAAFNPTDALFSKSSVIKLCNYVFQNELQASSASDELANIIHTHIKNLLKIEENSLYCDNLMYNLKRICDHEEISIMHGLAASGDLSADQMSDTSSKLIESLRLHAVFDGYMKLACSAMNFSTIYKLMRICVGRLKKVLLKEDTSILKKGYYISSSSISEIETLILLPKDFDDTKLVLVFGKKTAKFSMTSLLD